MDDSNSIKRQIADDFLPQANKRLPSSASAQRSLRGSTNMLLARRRMLPLGKKHPRPLSNQVCQTSLLKRQMPVVITTGRLSHPDKQAFRHSSLYILASQDGSSCFAYRFSHHIFILPQQEPDISGHTNLSTPRYADNPGRVTSLFLQELSTARATPIFTFRQTPIDCGGDLVYRLLQTSYSSTTSLLQAGGSPEIFSLAFHAAAKMG